MIRRLIAMMLLLPFFAVHAAKLDAKPGLWKMTQDDEDEDFECITAKELADSSNWVQKARKDLSAGCTMSNLKESSRQISFSTSCSSPTNKGSGSMQIAFESPTKSEFRYSFKGSTVAGTQTIPVVLDIVQRGEWVSADCGEHAGDEAESE